MNENKIVPIGLFSLLMLFSFVPTAQAELWEFIVELDIEKDVAYSGDTVVVTGRIVDHAYEPTRGVEVLIRTGSETIKDFTDPNGMFKAEFVDFQRIPGTYTVNVVASWYDITGLSSTQFQVKGDITPISELQEKLATDEARKYLGSEETDFEKNPIGQTLFKYYHGLHDKLIKEQREMMKSEKEQGLIQQQRTIAEGLKNQALAKRSTGAGIYNGIQYEDYIKNLNPQIKDLVTSQMNFTKNSFTEAQNIRDEIIKNGGTYEEARQAFLDKISISKKTLDEFNQLQLDKNSGERQSYEQSSENASRNE